MIEIQPIKTYPIVQTGKPVRDEKKTEKHPRKERQHEDVDDDHPIQHIDEIV